jgi:phage terminase large subunit GpA-like protein
LGIPTEDLRSIARILAAGYLRHRKQLRRDAPGRDQEYFDQLTAEKKYTRYHHGYPKQEWRKPPTARNEALDCRVYAYAALHALYASGLKLTVYCDRFAQMGRSRRKEMQSIPPAVVVAQAEQSERAVEGRTPDRADGWVPRRDWFGRS